MKKILYLFILLLCSSIQLFGQNSATQSTVSGTLNPGGGVRTNGTDGMEVVVTGNGNIQVKYKGNFQMYDGRQPFSPSNNNSTPGGTDHSLVLGFTAPTNDTYTSSGGASFIFLKDPDPNKKDPISPTVEQNFKPKSFRVYNDTSDTTGKTQKFEGNYDILLNGRTYVLKVEYTYIHPNPRLLINYTLTIPANNPLTQDIKFAHFIDTYLSGGDNGPGYAIDNTSVLSTGVRKGTNFEAFVYKDGVKWSGYYSANYQVIGSYLGTVEGGKFMEFDGKFIDPNPATDNGMGISINFGAQPGTFTSTNILTFVCNAPTAAPTGYSSSYSLTCLQGYQDIAYKGTPPTMVDTNNDGINDITVRYEDSTGKLITPKNGQVNVGPGTYKVYFYDTENGCMSAATTVTVTKPACNSDLSITKNITTLGPNNTVVPGQTYTITYTAANTGSDNGKIVMTDILPNGFTLVTFNTTTGTYANGVWNIGDFVTSTGSKTLTLTVTANKLGYFRSTATITGTNAEANLTNNTSNPIVNLDTDGDGVPNNVDNDSDNDGILDSLEKGNCDANSILSFSGYRAVIYDNELIGGDLINSWNEISASNTFPTNSYSEVGRFTYYEFEKKSNAFDILFDTPNVKNLGFASANTAKIRNFVGAEIKSGTSNNDYAVMFNKTITSDEVGTYQFQILEGDDHIFIYKNGIKINSFKNVWATTPRPTVAPITLAEGDVISILLVEEGFSNTQISMTATKTSGTCMRDTDLDGIPDHLDLDSDGDNCPDAIEGGDDVKKSQLNTDGSINTTTNGGINANGVPNLVNPGGAADKDGAIGQTAGSAYNSSVNSCPTFCLKPANITGTALSTNAGISTIGQQNGWPQNSKGAFLALQSQTKGLVISRIDSPETTITNPQEGMMVYDNDGVNATTGCLKIYSNGSWKCFNNQSCPDL